MVRFYDPIDSSDLERVMAILSRGGIEFSLGAEPVQGLGPRQIHVAEEDLPKAERLLLQTRH
jgi:hypothetical protein